MTDPIRVLCVFATLNRGGAENMCMNLYRAIDRSKIQFDFVKHTPEHCAFESEILSLGGKIFEAPRYKAINRFRYENWWRSFFKEHEEYRLIHGHYFTISYIYFKIAHEFHLTTIGHAHSEQANKKQIKSIIKRASRKWIEKESDICLACSNAAGKYLFPHKKFIVLKNAIDTDKFIWNADTSREVRSELGISKNIRVIGACGSFSPPKNPKGIIRIFYEIHKRDKNTKLLWVGDGLLRQAVEKKILQYGLTESVILTGVRSDVNRLMQAMDIFILPSLWEGMAVVSIEAQAAGLPCFFSDKVTRECQVTKTCYFLPLNHPKLWADRIIKCRIVRRDTGNQIKAAGFDIATTAVWLGELYLRTLRKE